MIDTEIDELAIKMIHSAPKIEDEELFNVTVIMAILGLYMRMHIRSSETNKKHFGFDPVELQEKHKVLINSMKDCITDEFRDYMVQTEKIIKLLKDK